METLSKPEKSSSLREGANDSLIGQSTEPKMEYIDRIFEEKREIMKK
jgi:hypothetical protein